VSDGGHAYCVMEVKEACGMRMLKIRNPHAGNEWQGDFSDADGRWHEMPDLAEACGHTTVGEHEDGEFWMPFGEFKEGFRDVAVNLQPHTNDLGDPQKRFTDEGADVFTEDDLAVENHEW